MVKRYIDVFLEKDANIILEITKINGYMPPKKKKKKSDFINSQQTKIFNQNGSR